MTSSIRSQVLALQDAYPVQVEIHTYNLFFILYTDTGVGVFTGISGSVIMNEEFSKRLLKLMPELVVRPWGFFKHRKSITSTYTLRRCHTSVCLPANTDLLDFCLFGLNVAFKHQMSYHDGACL